MQGLGLTSQEKQDPPIVNQDHELMVGNSQQEIPDRDSDENTAETLDETMPSPQ